MNILNFGGSIALICGTLMAFAGGPANAAPVKNIVLVHGAFADGSGWKAVYKILANDGYNVTAAQPPLTGLEDDVAAVSRVLRRQHQRASSRVSLALQRARASSERHHNASAFHPAC